MKTAVERVETRVNSKENDFDYIMRQHKITGLDALGLHKRTAVEHLKTRMHPK